MRMITLKWIAVLAVVLAAVGYGVYAAKQRTRAEAALVSAAEAAKEDLDAVRMQLGATQKTATRSEQRAVRAEEQLMSLEQKTRGLFSNQTAAALTPAPVGLLGRAPSSTGTPAFTVSSGRYAMGSQAREREGVRMNIAYALFYRRVGFLAEQRERFGGLLLDNLERGNTDQLLVAAVGREFGEATAAALRHYQAIAPLRGLNIQLATALFYSETPLTVPQADQLLDLLDKNASRPDGRVDVTEIDKGATMMAARAILSPPQLEVFKVYLDQILPRGGSR